MSKFYLFERYLCLIFSALLPWCQNKEKRKAETNKQNKKPQTMWWEKDKVNNYKNKDWSVWQIRLTPKKADLIWKHWKKKGMLFYLERQK